MWDAKGEFPLYLADGAADPAPLLEYLCSALPTTQARVIDRDARSVTLSPFYLGLRRWAPWNGIKACRVSIPPPGSGAEVLRYSISHPFIRALAIGFCILFLVVAPLDMLLGKIKFDPVLLAILVSGALFWGAIYLYSVRYAAAGAGRTLERLVRTFEGSLRLH